MGQPLVFSPRPIPSSLQRSLQLQPTSWPLWPPLLFSIRLRPTSRSCGSRCFSALRWSSAIGLYSPNCILTFIFDRTHGRCHPRCLSAFGRNRPGCSAGLHPNPGYRSRCLRQTSRPLWPSLLVSARPIPPKLNLNFQLRPTSRLLWSPLVVSDWPLRPQSHPNVHL